MIRLINTLKTVIIETAFPHEIRSESYWRKIIASIPQPKQREYMTRIFDGIMRKQRGFASDRQMQLLKRAERGDASNWHPKN
jgi:hypothetical protein